MSEKKTYELNEEEQAKLKDPYLAQQKKQTRSRI